MHSVLNVKFHKVFILFNRHLSNLAYAGCNRMFRLIMVYIIGSSDVITIKIQTCTSKQNYLKLISHELSEVAAKQLCHESCS